jgi:hypothetical protein
MATEASKEPSRNKGGRPRGRLNNRTLLLQAGLDKAIPDRYFWRKVKEFIEAGDAQVLIQVGKWKGLKEKHEVDLSGIPANGIFTVISE